MSWPWEDVSAQICVLDSMMDEVDFTGRKEAGMYRIVIVVRDYPFTRRSSLFSDRFLSFQHSSAFISGA